MKLLEEYVIIPSALPQIFFQNATRRKWCLVPLPLLCRPTPSALMPAGIHKSPPQGMAETIWYNAHENDMLAKAYFFLFTQGFIQDKNSLNMKNMNKIISRAQTIMVKINSTQGRNFKCTVSAVSVPNGIPMAAVSHEPVWKETSSRWCGSYARWISPRDLLYSLVPRDNNTVLYLTVS